MRLNSRVVVVVGVRGSVRASAARTTSITSNGRTVVRAAAAFYDYIWWRYEFQQRHADGGKRVDEYEYDAGDEWGGETRWGASRGGDARVCVRGERE